MKPGEKGRSKREGGTYRKEKINGDGKKQKKKPKKN